MLKRITCLLCLYLATVSPLSANTAQRLFAEYADRLYQIKVIERISNRKSALGSGFLVRADGLMVTNYHVISKFIHEPDKYYLQAISVSNNVEKVTVEDFDIINDLALIKIGGSKRPYLTIKQGNMRKGDAIYSMGNPLDLGTAVVPGTYNGYTRQSYYQRIHFTGAINPGMSGGPVVNNKGEVVGVNVATAGNQVGFLVVAKKLVRLFDAYKKRPKKKLDFQAHIRQQLLTNQRQLMGAVLAADWKTTSLGEAKVLNEIVPFIPCWGDKGHSRRQKDRFLTVSIQCRPKETVYIKQGFTTGMIEVQYRWSQNIALSNLQFTTLLEQLFGGARAGNAAGERDVTEYSCHESFVGQPDERAVFCSRAYRHYADLFDVLYISITVGHEDKALLSHFTLSGVEQKLAMQFLNRFMESRKWN